MLIPSSWRISGSQEMVEKNAIDCRPIRPAIDQPSGLRHGGSPTGAGTGSWALAASGSQAAAANSAGMPHSASTGSQPPSACSSGTARNVATVAPPTRANEYAPVSTPARSGARARTSAGTTTWESAIAAPASSVPA